jgi:hypothetical protein
MPPLALLCLVTRAEDTALLRSNRSAVPGAKTEERVVGFRATARPSSLRDWPQSDKPSRHDAATRLTGGPSPLANVHPPQFQFTVNQDISLSGLLASRARLCFSRHQH